MSKYIVEWQEGERDFETSKLAIEFSEELKAEKKGGHIYAERNGVREEKPFIRFGLVFSGWN